MTQVSGKSDVIVCSWPKMPLYVVQLDFQVTIICVWRDNSAMFYFPFIQNSSTTFHRSLHLFNTKQKIPRQQRLPHFAKAYHFWKMCKFCKVSVFCSLGWNTWIPDLQNSDIFPVLFMITRYSSNVQTITLYSYNQPGNFLKPDEFCF